MEHRGDEYPPAALYCILTNTASSHSALAQQCNEETIVHILAEEKCTPETSSFNSNLLNNQPISITKPAHVFLIFKQNNECKPWVFEEAVVESNARNIEVYVQSAENDEKEEYWATVRGNASTCESDPEFFSTTISPPSPVINASNHDDNSTIVYCIHLKLLSLRPSNQTSCYIRKLHVQWRRSIEEHPNHPASSLLVSDPPSMDTMAQQNTVFTYDSSMVQTLQTLLDIQIKKNVAMNQSLADLSEQIKTLQVTMMVSQQEVLKRFTRIEDKLDQIIHEQSINASLQQQQQQQQQQVIENHKDEESILDDCESFTKREDCADDGEPSNKRDCL